MPGVLLREMGGIRGSHPSANTCFAAQDDGDRSSEILQEAPRLALPFENIRLTDDRKFPEQWLGVRVRAAKISKRFPLDPRPDHDHETNI